MPFENQTERAIHFKKHGHKFGAADETAYEQMADAFMFGAMSVDTRECLRPQRDRLRFEAVRTHFGVAATEPRDFIRTFYPVNPDLIRRRGGNVGFFAYECGRVNL